MTPPLLSAPATEGSRPAGAFLRRLGEAALDFLLPPRCIGCDEPVVHQNDLCSACFLGLTIITEPLCGRCGLPFASRDVAGPCCAACAAAPPAFRHGRAPFLYDAGISRLILAFKHGDKPTLARALAPHMARAGSALLADRPLLVPVPLHRMRMLRRHYNQAALLVRALSRITACPEGLDVLRRTSATVSLDDRSPAERRAILDGVIDVKPVRRRAVHGRRVVLVDDVMTSGATADTCARALLRAGATEVDVLVAARVPLARGS